MHAYDEMYCPLAQRVMGDMYDFAVNALDRSLSDFHGMFMTCGMAKQFEIGNPTYVAGKNGCEVAKIVVEKCTGVYPEAEDSMELDKSPEYWIGWSLAYYQWERGMSFRYINNSVPIDEMYGMYPTLHEADISLYVHQMDSRIMRIDNCSGKESQLKRLRKYAELSQSQLAARSGVPLRQIQLFEQGQRDISKTQLQTAVQLARALNCRAEELLH
ncbi:MAG: helix-turn-helix transcriptional regulator [Eubacteriales bacterium]|nr:helix-turn-helix transcriptional regulator [Eubacteriales bacterium]